MDIKDTQIVYVYISPVEFYISVIELKMTEVQAEEWFRHLSVEAREFKFTFKEILVKGSTCSTSLSENPD